MIFTSDIEKSCSKRHCQKSLELKHISYKIEPTSSEAGSLEGRAGQVASLVATLNRGAPRRGKGREPYTIRPLNPTAHASSLPRMQAAVKQADVCWS